MIVRRFAIWCERSDPGFVGWMRRFGEVLAYPSLEAAVDHASELNRVVHKKHVRYSARPYVISLECSTGGHGRCRLCGCACVDCQPNHGGEQAPRRVVYPTPAKARTNGKVIGRIPPEVFEES